MQLQYITQDLPEKTHQELVETACSLGIKWVQLRMKHYCFDECRKIAEESLAITKKYGAKLIINDFMEVALAVKADGIHLGKEDMAISIAKKMAPPGFIIGGTANTFEDVQRLALASVNYIGLGPYSFTKTKIKLSPILGLQGYQDIMEQCKLNHIETPIVAIGGILPKDVAALVETGISGIAISSAITHAADQEDVVTKFSAQLRRSEGKKVARQLS